MKKSHKRNPVGRPPFEITPMIIEKAEEYAVRGLTIEQVAMALGMGQTTLYEKKSAFPEFAQAIKRGAAKHIAITADALLKNVKSGNVAAQIFTMKCRAGWKETERIEHSGPDGDPVQFGVVLLPPKAEDKK